MKPNRVFYSLVAAGALAALGAAVLAAEAHGRRQARRAWLTERSAS